MQNLLTTQQQLIRHCEEPLNSVSYIGDVYNEYIAASDHSIHNGMNCDSVRFSTKITQIRNFYDYNERDIIAVGLGSLAVIELVDFETMNKIYKVRHLKLEPFLDFVI